MVLHEVELNINELEIFRRSGALSVKHYHEAIQMGDEVIVRTPDGTVMGPFAVRDDERGIYCGTDRNDVQIMCCFPEQNEEECKLDADTVTGSLELDGLIKNCRIDEKKGQYYILFEKDVVDAVPIYSGMLSDAGVANKVMRRKYLYILDDDVCRRCLEQPFFYEEKYLSGFFAPNMCAKRGSPGRDATPDLFIARGLKNIPSDLDRNLLPWKVILYSMNNSLLISALSFRNHPCNQSIWGFCDIDEFQSEQSPVTSDEGLSGFAASELMEEVLSMSGYSVDVMWSKGNVRYITARRGERLYDIILTPSIDDDLRSCIDANPVPMESLLIPTRSDGPYLNIIPLADVEKSDYDHSMFHMRLQNLDTNTFVPLVPSLIREMKIKLDLLWSLR